MGVALHRRAHAQTRQYVCEKKNEPCEVGVIAPLSSQFHCSFPHTVAVCVSQMHFLVCPPFIQAAADINLRSALATAVLLLDCEHDTHKTTTIKAAAQARKVTPSVAVSVSAASSSPDTDPSSAAAAAASTPAAAAAEVASSADSSSHAAAASSFPVPLRSLFHRIASLSYFGDIRMGVAENPHKVANIVAGSWVQLQNLYAKHIAAMGFIGPQQQDAKKADKPMDLIQLPCSPASRAALLATLPANFQAHIHPQSQPLTAAAASTSFWHELALRPAAQRQQLLSGALATIVARSSKQQTLKGLATAGVRKSFRYGMAKMKKALLRK